MLAKGAHTLTKHPQTCHIFSFQFYAVDCEAALQHYFPLQGARALLKPSTARFEPITISVDDVTGSISISSVTKYHIVENSPQDQGNPSFWHTFILTLTDTLSMDELHKLAVTGVAPTHSTKEEWAALSMQQRKHKVLEASARHIQIRWAEDEDQDLASRLTKTDERLQNNEERLDDVCGMITERFAAVRDSMHSPGSPGAMPDVEKRMRDIAEQASMALVRAQGAGMAAMEQHINSLQTQESETQDTLEQVA